MEVEQRSKHIFNDGYVRFSFKKNGYSSDQIRAFIFTHMEEFTVYDLRCLLAIDKYGTNLKDYEFKHITKLYPLRPMLAKRLLSTTIKHLFIMGDYLEAIYE